MPGSWLHLGRRFTISLGVRALTPHELDVLSAVLTEAEVALFGRQSDLDQRHGYQSAVFAQNAGGSPEMVRAAALHDIGKRHAGLGVVGRVVASIVIKLGLPTRRRIDLYRRHGQLGAAELLEIGSPDLVVTYTRHHHDARPTSFDARTWGLLTAADEATERSRSVTGEG